MPHGSTRRTIRVAMLAAVLAAAAGCQSPSHDTGQMYNVSEQFEGHVGKHMPIVFEGELGVPAIEVTMCRKATDASRPEMASYNIHVQIYSSNKKYDLADNRLEFVADGVRMSLARSGAFEAGHGEQAANYPISAKDLETLAAADDITMRINTADTHLERHLDAAQVAALDDFYVVCVAPDTTRRQAGVND